MSTTFAGLGVPDNIARALAARGITEPFPIQAATIPDGLAGRDLTGKAPTGSGKTIAFGVPMAARVQRAAPKRPKGLVLAPTRELALQVAGELQALNGDLRVLAVYGGAGIEPQMKKLRAGVDIVVACPGRLLDLIERRCCDLRDVSFAVVDEADRMADMGFLPDVRRILDMTNEDRQTVLFSATLDGAVDQLVKHYQHDPVVHEMHEEDHGGVTTHHFWVSDRHTRLALVAQIVARTGSSIVFCRTKHGSDRVAKQLGNAGIHAAAIHGNRSQAQRERALDAFHRGEVAALVATDVAARGIHVEGVQCVIHYDLPADHKDYIHRSGRTGRAGLDGTVVALFDAKQRRDAVKLKKAAGLDIEISDPVVDALPEGKPFVAKAPRRGSRPERAERSGSGERRHGGRDRDRDRGPDRRPKAARPERKDRDARPERSERSDRAERSARPERAARPVREDRAARAERSPRPDRATRAERPARPERSERPARDDAADRSTQSPSKRNRAERRANQFSEEERVARAEANKRNERTGRPKPAGDRSRSSRPAGRSDERALPANTPGADKVRPSGASRRKAKREALVAAGIEPERTKRKRSGKPRPPKPVR
jgi:superfamily II DNA/RNA helicase